MSNTLVNPLIVSAQEKSSGAAMPKCCSSTVSTTSAEMTLNAMNIMNTVLPLFQEMFPSAKPRYKGWLIEPTIEDCHELFPNLKSCGKFTSLYWLMSPDPQIQPKPLPVPTIEENCF